MRQRVRIRILRVLASGLLVLAAFPVAAEAADSGTIGTTVTGAAPCIEVSGSFAFGTLPFSTTGGTSGKAVAGATATNCGAQDEVFLARGSTATNGATSWSLSVIVGDPPCGSDGTLRNAYGMDISRSDGTSALHLSDSDQTFLTAVPVSSSQEFHGSIAMPCTGSDGAGLEMTSTITLTATF